MSRKTDTAFCPTRHIRQRRWPVNLYRAIEQHGHVIDVLVPDRRDGAAARAFFARALKSGPAAVEITTGRTPIDPRVIDEVIPAARHVLEQYSNNSVEADHGEVDTWQRPDVTSEESVQIKVLKHEHAELRRANALCVCPLE